jgi:archaellum biogenesis ATPase FlaH
MLGMTTTMEPLTAGIKAIAETLGGGIKEGSLILVDGEAKAGKSILVQYVAYGVLNTKSCSVAYYVTELGAEDLITNMDSISLWVRHARVTDRFRIYEPGKAFEHAQESLQLITSNISGLPERFKLTVVDSVSLFMTHLSPTAKIDFLESCKEICERKGCSIVLTVNNCVFEKTARLRAYDLSDYYLSLRSQDVLLAPGQVDTRVIKTLEVTKLAGAECHGRPSLKFEIKPKVGIQILPLIRVRV